jgi:peptidoglycan hydrolase-like protein with peptidoglycan-binding domain
MKKLLVRAAVFLMATVGVVVGTAGNALACNDPGGTRSDELAARLPQVNYGDHGRYALELQLALRFQGYKNLQGTGNYADSTLAAVQDFQRKNGINDSGIVGSKTWHALVGSIPSLLTHNSDDIVRPTYGINPGEDNPEKMSQLTNLLMRIYPYQVGNGPDAYGPELVSVVQDFQRRAGIKDSGIVGPLTWDALYQTVAVSGGWSC